MVGSSTQASTQDDPAPDPEDSMSWKVMAHMKHFTDVLASATRQELERAAEFGEAAVRTTGAVASVAVDAVAGTAEKRQGLLNGGIAAALFAVGLAPGDAFANVGKLSEVGKVMNYGLTNVGDVMGWFQA